MPSPPSPADDPLDRLSRACDELHSVSGDEAEETGRFEVSKSGAIAKGIPRWAMGLVGGAIALGLLALAVAWAISLARR